AVVAVLAGVGDATTRHSDRLTRQPQRPGVQLCRSIGSGRPSAHNAGRIRQMVDQLDIRPHRIAYVRHMWVVGEPVMA
ncbi:hypothetical protein, partial [Micromonospora sp. CPCC 206061]|uniref:hypothetical protein n=1 Tax=Micromonospora sp. CPCC 206061 TaxID=3122410 RepID=UPI002FF3FCB4